MRFFATASTQRVRDAMGGDLGMIATPAARNVPPPGVAWCADNGAYGKSFTGGATGWFDWLVARPWDRSLCAFAVAPDVVGDAAATLERSRPWFAPVRELGLPVAFVAQDGAERTTIPWADFDVLFIGGTTSFKLGPVAADLASEAREHGRPIHMGRVNTRRRLRYAASIGCASADGTLLAFGPDKNLRALLGWLAELNAPGLQELNLS